MEAAERLEALMTELAVSFEKEVQEDGVIRYDISAESSEDEVFNAILYPTEVGHFVRLMAYIDELNHDNETVMLKELMAMNGELPLGAYCMDPDEELVYATINLAIEGLSAQALAEAVEFLFMAQDLFDETFFPESMEPDGSTPEAKA